MQTKQNRLMRNFLIFSGVIILLGIALLPEKVAIGFAGLCYSFSGAFFAWFSFFDEFGFLKNRMKEFNGAPMDHHMELSEFSEPVIAAFAGAFFVTIPVSIGIVARAFIYGI